MTRSKAKEHVETAERHRSSGELKVADDHDTLAAYDYLGDAKLVDDVPPKRERLPEIFTDLEDVAAW